MNTVAASVRGVAWMVGSAGTPDGHTQEAMVDLEIRRGGTAVWRGHPGGDSFVPALLEYMNLDTAMTCRERRQPRG